MAVLLPVKFARFQDGMLDRHLEDLYAYLRNLAAGGTSGTDTNTTPYFYVVSYTAAGLVSNESTFTDSGRATKIGTVDYVYDSSSRVSRVTTKSYNLNRLVSTKTTIYAYNSNGSFNTETQTVVS